MPPAPLQLTVRPTVDTQGTDAQVANGMIASGLIRIKNGRIQKLGGCTLLIQAFMGYTANVTLRWNPTIETGTGTATELFIAIGAAPLLGIVHFESPSWVSYVITPAGLVSTGPWTLALWGSWLLAGIGGGTIYYWIPTDPASGLALPVSSLAGATGVPTEVNGIFVAAPQQQAFAWGIYSATLGGQDPLLIGWCDIANLQDWTASATNQAGSFKLSSGSAIVDATWFGSVGIIWTDIELWSIQYISFPLVYGFQRVAQNCGLIAPQAWGALGTLIAWMGQNDFYSYQGGSVQAIPCSVRDFIFNTLDRDFVGTIHCDVNTYGHEMTWRFPQVGSNGKCNAYVKWSPSENNAWDFWSDPPGASPTVMWLSCWADAAGGQPPLGIDYNSNILQFETSNDYDGAPLESFFLTGWFYISDGQEDVFIERINPDFIFTTQPGGMPSGSVSMTLYLADEIPSNQADYPVRTYGPYTVTPATPFIIVRGRGRVLQIRVSCTTANTFWRYGSPMARIGIDGTR